jgi:hypothetical protein
MTLGYVFLDAWCGRKERDRGGGEREREEREREREKKEKSVAPEWRRGNLPRGLLASGGAFPFQSKLSYKWGS